MKVPAQKPSPAVGPRRKPGINEPLEKYTKVPNLLDVLISENKLSGFTQVKLIWILIRSTWGSEKRPEWASLSLRQIAERCGGIESSTISSELKDLAERKIIECQPGGKGCTDTKRYKVTPEHWRDAKPYTKKELPEASDTEQKGVSGDTLIVRPGGKGKCVPAQLRPAGSEPVNFQIAYTNVGSLPLTISSSIEADLVRITFCNHRGDQKAKQGKRLFSTESSQKANTDANNRLTEFEFCIKSLFTSHFDKPFDTGVAADRKLAKSILKNAGEDLPAADFETYCKAELRAMVRRHKEIYPGILVSMAEQAARKFAASQCNFASDSPVATPPPDYELPTFTPEQLAEFTPEQREEIEAMMTRAKAATC